MWTIAQDEPLAGELLVFVALPLVSVSLVPFPTDPFDVSTKNSKMLDVFHSANEGEVGVARNSQTPVIFSSLAYGMECQSKLGFGCEVCSRSMREQLITL